MNIFSTELHTCSLKVEKVNADSVTVSYKGLPGNLPEDYQNFVAIWDSTAIRWNSAPMTKQPVPQNDETGDFVIHDVKITKKAYILGYGVGEAISDICATSKISPIVPMILIPDYVYISIANINARSITVNYYTLPGYLPGEFKNWIGLWEGIASPYYATEPLGTVSITKNSSQGSIGIDDVTISEGMTYTLVYFMGADAISTDWPKSITNAGALLYFETGKADSALPIAG